MPDNRWNHPQPWIKVIHDADPDPCHRTAFYVLERPHLGEVVNPALVRLADGTIPEPDSFMYCGACGRLITTSSVTPADGGYADV